MNLYTWNFLTFAPLLKVAWENLSCWVTLFQHTVAKTWFLCLTKTLERPWILHAIHNLICFNCSDVESKTHAETRSRWLVDAILNFGVFVRAFPTQVLTISSWCSRHKLCGNFDQSIAVPTNMLNGFQSSCDRQHRQQPLLHNSKWLFSRYKCVLRKWKFSKDTRNLFASHVKCPQEFKVYFEFRLTNKPKKITTVTMGSEDCSVVEIRKG